METLKLLFLDGWDPVPSQELRKLTHYQNIHLIAKMAASNQITRHATAIPVHMYHSRVFSSMLFPLAWFIGAGRPDPPEPVWTITF